MQDFRRDSEKLLGGGVIRGIFCFILILSVAAKAQVRSDSQPTPLPRLKNPNHWLAIVGDSGVTGAGVDPELSAEWLALGAEAISFLLLFDSDTDRWGRLKHIPNPERYGIFRSLTPMTRIFHSMEEYRDAVRQDKVMSLIWKKKAFLKLDLEEYTFGYLVGRALGIEPQDIVMVGQQGTRIETLYKQFARINEVSDTLPPLVLVSFTANDLCHRSIFTTNPKDRIHGFEGILRLQFSNILLQSKPHPKGTRVVVLAPFNVVTLLTDQDLLEQKVRFEDHGEVQCGDLRHGKVRNGFLATQMLDMFNRMCGSILETKPGDTKRIARIRELQEGFTDTWEKVIKEFNNRKPGLRFEFVRSIRDIDFQKGDLANDCFHPGVKGHARVADHLLKILIPRP